MKLTTGVDFLCQQASSCLDKGKAELCPLTDLMFKKKFRFENIKIFFFKSNHKAKNEKLPFKIYAMLPFVKGNLDRYFVCSFAIFFLFL